MRHRLFSILTILVFVAQAFADGERDNHPNNVRRIPKAGVPVPAEKEKSLREKLGVLKSKIAELEASKSATTTALLPDVTIFERAVRVALDHNEFFSPKDIDKADQVLDEGISRADQLLAGNPEWPTQSGLVVRGYVSRIDQTPQPYGLVVPATYAFDHSVQTRCDIWFHGRGETLSELNFIWGRMKTAGQYTPNHTIVLHPYGRYSNAFKFAGETDVLEALQDVQNRYRIDDDRISVRGFSMGGAACWQFAVHFADRWFAANPGAGFSETPEFLKFFQKETLNPTVWEKALWNLYDCNRYAWNLTHCPTIAYSGENDIQKQAADIMEVALQKFGIHLRHIIGPKMGHRIDPGSKEVIEASLAELARKGRETSPKSVVFETYTLKYNRMHWLTVDGLIEHWKPARVSVIVEQKSTDRPFSTIELTVSTANVSEFTLEFPAGTFPVDQNPLATDECSIHALIGSAEEIDSAGKVPSISGDGPFSDGSARLQAHRNANGVWVKGPAAEKLRKRHDLQGPIDDAFMDSFVFVRPTGKAANEAVGKWAAAELERAIEHWRRHFRGDARVIDDRDFTDEIVQSANLVLWGDPSSNSVMARITDKLPIKWTNQQITVGPNNFDAAHHAPILIYPNPLNPKRYVVFNSSFTYRDYAYLNNARQVPMLPDWAIVDLRTPPGNVWPGKIAAADFFDEQWQLKD